MKSVKISQAENVTEKSISMFTEDQSFRSRVWCTVTSMSHDRIVDIDLLVGAIFAQVINEQTSPLLARTTFIEFCLLLQCFPQFSHCNANSCSNSLSVV